MPCSGRLGLPPGRCERLARGREAAGGGYIRQITDVKPAHCRYCRKRIDGSATACLYCQHDVRPWTARHAPLVIVGGVLMSLFVMAVVLTLWQLFQP
jgi:hypothetical protein